MWRKTSSRILLAARSPRRQEVLLVSFHVDLHECDLASVDRQLIKYDDRDAEATRRRDPVDVVVRLFHEQCAKRSERSGLCLASPGGGDEVEPISADYQSTSLENLLAVRD